MAAYEYSALRLIIAKVQKIMDSLKISHQQNQANETVTEIFQSIDKKLDQILTQLVQPNEQSYQTYDSLQKQLQKQENLNRMLIKRELEFKEYQKCVIEQLNAQKNAVNMLKTQLSKANEKVIAKDLQILKFNSQRKSKTKDKKNIDFFTLETVIQEKKFGNSMRNIKPGVMNLHNRKNSGQIMRRSETAMSKQYLNHLNK